MLLEQQVSDRWTLLEIEIPSCRIFLIIEYVSYCTCHEKLFADVCGPFEFLSWSASWQSMKRSSSGSIVVFSVTNKLSVTCPSISVYFLLVPSIFLARYPEISLKFLAWDQSIAHNQQLMERIPRQVVLLDILSINSLSYFQKLEVESYELLVRRPNFAFVEVNIFPPEEKISDFSIFSMRKSHFFTYFPKRWKILTPPGCKRWHLPKPNPGYV